MHACKLSDVGLITYREDICDLIYVSHTFLHAPDESERVTQQQQLIEVLTRDNIGSNKRQSPTDTCTALSLLPRFVSSLNQYIPERFAAFG